MSEWASLTAGVALLMAVLGGWGALTARALAGRRVGCAGPGLPGLFDCGVLGAATLYLAGAAWSFARALTPAVGDAAVAVGLAGCAIAVVRRWWGRRRTLGEALLALPLAAFVAWGARTAPLSFDVGLYHLQHLQWLRTEPLPLGLAQLNERLGFNSAWMTITALVGATRAHRDATYLLAAALAALVGGALIARGRAALGRRRLDWAPLAGVLVAVVVLSGAPHGLFSWFGLSPSNDLPAALLTLYALTTGAWLLAERARASRNGADAALFPVVIVAGVLASAIKLSQLATTAAVLLLVPYRLARTPEAANRRAAYRAGILAGGLAVVWLAQNVALSGCLLFPRAESCFESLPWSLESASVERVALWVQAWARAPGEHFLALASAADWPRTWAQRMLPERRLLHHLAIAMALGAVALLALRVAVRRWPRAPSLPGGARWALAAAFAGVVACALGAPDPRFAYGSLLMAAAGTLALLVRPVEITTPRRAAACRVVGATALVLAAASAVLPLRAATSAAQAAPAWRQLPQPEFTLRRLPEGLAVRVPVGTEQCWALPLPCAPASGREVHAERRFGRWVFTRVASPGGLGEGSFDARRALRARWELLGLELAPLARLTFDALLLFVLAGWAARWLGGPHGPPLRRVLASALVGLALIVVSPTALGALGRLTPASLAAVPRALAVLLGLVLVLRRGVRGAAREVAAALAYPLAAATRAWRASWRRREAASGWRLERPLLVATAIVLAFFGVLAVAAQPLNWDAQTYRLARVALWLQQASLDHLPTNDSRLNFVGQNADLVMLWLVSHFRRGFPLVHLVQFAGGLLACLATVEIGTQLGLRRPARLAAALTLLGIPTVGLQFFTAQTDLFVAGTLAAGLAFLLPALRSGRRRDWTLVGVGGGIALGAKATVIYWGIGLVALLAFWAISERSGWRRTSAGVMLSAAVALPLCAFNFVQNERSFGNPFASESAISRTLVPVETAARAPLLPAVSEVASPAAASVGPRRTNGEALVWQLLMPSSNPLLPEALLKPPFEALLDRLAENSVHYRQLRLSLVASQGWAAHGLSEDEASFGLVVPLLALVAGGVALLRVLRRRGTAADLRTLGLAAAVALFLVLFCVVSLMTLYQYRYFCLLAPFTALLAVVAVESWRGRLGRALATLLVFSQVAVALHLGWTSEYHGLRAVIDPRRSQYDFLWSEPRALLADLGERPLRLGLALPRDSWIAPFLRSGVEHRVRLLTLEQLAASTSLASLLDTEGLDAVVVAPEIAPPLGAGLRALPLPRVTGRNRRLALRRLRPGDVERPLVVWAFGVDGNGVTERQSYFRLAAWRRGSFELVLENPSPRSRSVALRNGASSATFELPAGGRSAVSLPVGVVDELTLEALPAAGDPDAGAAGVRLAPASISSTEGLDADGWSRPHAVLELTNWLAGTFELEVENPAAFAREVELRSGVESIHTRLAAGESTRLRIAVYPRDRLELEVEPPLAAAAIAGGGDARELGLLLRGESRQLLSPGGH